MTIYASQFLKKEHISFLDESSMESALHKLINCLVVAGALINPSEFYNAIIEREEISSTGIGLGIALPHAKMEEIKDFFIAIGVHTGAGIGWGSIDNVKVKLICLIGGPKNMHKEYLSILSQLTRSIKDVKRRQQIVLSREKDAIINLFKIDY